jgi:hypothetical protein
MIVNECFDLRAVFEALSNMEKFVHALEGYHVTHASWRLPKSVCVLLHRAQVMTDMASSCSNVIIRGVIVCNSHDCCIFLTFCKKKLLPSVHM